MLDIQYKPNSEIIIVTGNPMKAHATSRFAAILIASLAMLSCLSAASAAESQAPARRLRVPLPGQAQNAIKESWPGIVCWFWTCQTDGRV
jgi:hypothetical protein